MRSLTNSAINDALDTLIFGRTLVLLPVTSSTNDVARDLAGGGAPEGTVVVTEEQTAGRGRLGRPWLAPPGTCLLFSILFRPHLPLTSSGELTMLCALAGADAVEEAAGLPVQLKWPNDLIVANPHSDPESAAWRKIAGLLNETEADGGHVSYTVVGLGVNVNVRPETLPTLAPDATSILAESGRMAERATLLAAILAGVEQRYKALQSGTSPHSEWAARLATLGQPVQALTGGRALNGVAEAVDEDGALLLRTPDGALHRLLAGVVSLSQS
jgi:BirA family biotin operon repressor/biotin-[acetyl-CoA-carboxylase] ligase